MNKFVGKEALEEVVNKINELEAYILRVENKGIDPSIVNTVKDLKIQLSTLTRTVNSNKTNISKLDSQYTAFFTVVQQTVNDLYDYIDQVNEVANEALGTADNALDLAHRIDEYLLFKFDDYENEILDRLMIKAVEDTSITITNPIATIYCSKDNESWEKIEGEKVIHAGELYYLYGDNIVLNKGSNSSCYIKFGSGKFRMKGNVMLLLSKDGSRGLSDVCFSKLFYESGIAESPTLPALELKERCYKDMFIRCKHLTKAPNLPATVMQKKCYESMFYECRNLVDAPVLQSTTLAEGCYDSMFGGCTSLTKAPELPATELKDACYSGMFISCSALTEAPLLPATKMCPYCYGAMFGGCKSLTQAPVLHSTQLAESCYNGMFQHCTGITEAPELPATQLAEGCYARMFVGCKYLTKAPELPATTLENNCYDTMFNGCTNLIKAPELPATQMKTNCYFNMFTSCESLNYIKIHLTSWDSSYATSWVYKVSSTGTFVKPRATEIPSGKSGIPDGWTVVDLEDVQEGDMSGDLGGNVSDNPGVTPH